MTQALQFILHLDRYLDGLLAVLGPWTYVLLFVVIFCETGLVVTPFLPGDSLLFAAGAVAAQRSDALSPWMLALVLAAAAVLGDSANYWIGRTIGPKILRNRDSRIFRREYLDRTEHFFRKYGGKTLVIARFVAIVRTFAPFMAGVGKMHYPRFLAFSFGGGVGWVTTFVAGGYLFGQVPLVKDNLAVVVLAVMIVPGVVAFFEHRRQRREDGLAVEAAPAGVAVRDGSAVPEGSEA